MWRRAIRLGVSAKSSMHLPVTTHGRLRRLRNTENGIHSGARPAWLSTYSSTGGRREDAVRLGPQHVRNGRVRFRQAKNEHRTPIDIDIPLHPELEASIAATPSGHLAFLATEFGRPFTPAGFGNWFRDQCDKANLHHCSAHGLRKATAAALAEAGASTHEIAAVTGHMSLEEVERYTRAVRRKKLADAAMAKLK
jgi:integrase/recombinase XerD